MILSFQGETPLDRAITCQTMNIIEALVDMGMNPNEKNKVQFATQCCVFSSNKDGINDLFLLILESPLQGSEIESSNAVPA